MPQEKYIKFTQNDKNYSVNPISINTLLNLHEKIIASIINIRVILKYLQLKDFT